MDRPLFAGSAGREGARLSGPAGRVPVVALTLAVLAALPYLVAGTGEFVAYDDNDYVFNNPRVGAGLSWEGALWSLTAFHAANWHPLTWLSHMLDVTLFGMDPRGHHLVSVLLHALGAALLFVALRRLTGAFLPSAFVAALFGTHPLHVESVAWVAERKDVLSGFLFMCVLLAYERYARSGGAGRYLAVAVLFAAGLAAKPMLVTVPLLLLLLDFWPLGRTFGTHPRTVRAVGRLCLEKAPLVALAAASSAVTVLAQREGGALVELQAFPLPLRIANALVSSVAYIGSALWPKGLAFYYPHPRGAVPWAHVPIAVALLAAVSLATAVWWKSRPFLACGWLWYMGMLAPVIGIVQVGEQARADRYTYLPLIGVFMMAAWLPSTLPRRGRGALLPAAAAVLVAACAAASAVQARYWHSSRTLFERAVAVTEGNWLAHNDLGVLLMKEGRTEEALGHFRQALRAGGESSFEAWNNVRAACSELGRHDEAVAAGRRALDLRPGAEANLNLGDTLQKAGRHEEALRYFREAISLKPDLAEAHHAAGLSLDRLGRLGEAALSYEAALRRRPGYAEAHVNLGAVLAQSGRLADAISHFREAVRLAPGNFEARVNLATALAASGEREAAVREYEAALALRPDDEAVRRRLEALRAR
jgi:tetratricopeptide (TPR) repeat protein